MKKGKLWLDVITVNHVWIIIEEAVISQGRDRRIRSCPGNLTMVASKPVNVGCVCVCVWV